MQAELRKPANLLSLARLLLVPILWLVAWLGYPQWLGIGLLVCGLTDMVDGTIARRLKQVSSFGAGVDSLADTAVFASAIVWALWFTPEIVSDNFEAVFITATVMFLSLSVGLVKFRRLANLHLTSSKIAGFALYALLVHALLFDAYSRPLFWAAWLLYTLSVVEMLLVQLLADKVDEDIGSLLNLWRGGGAPPADAS